MDSSRKEGQAVELLLVPEMTVGVGRRSGAAGTVLV
jgi:hypothetical protein